MSQKERIDGDGIFNFYGFWTAVLGDKKDEYLKDHKHINTICTRLYSAYTLMQEENKDDCFSNQIIFGINQCIHLATSIVLLGVKEDELKNIRTAISNEKKYQNTDATTIITIATLFYLLNDYAGNLIEAWNASNIDNGNDILRFIRERLDSVNWMIGSENMDSLGIKTI